MKKMILASLFLASLSFGANADVCDSSACGSLTLPQNPPVVADDEPCTGCGLYEETPMVPSLKDAKMVATGGGGCGGCDDKAQTLTPAQMKNLVADGGGDEGGGCGGCLYQPEMKNLVASNDDDGEGSGGMCGSCDLYPETPVVPSLKDAKMVAVFCTSSWCN